ncbi:complex I subunit 1 family protein [Actinomadura rupiterrae]|uniref:complex I subunit 1 family protein n=1 Tax=Actinomadura rupiterrae TaxID=559627 RepID=UPI0020A45771|nr:complex I subunit 1 family protein [Actinomadura rupiterrae]MCP2343821.1 NADH-quinone oxidoreductase subunit H [Actinomadura rupiterrae]
MSESVLVVPLLVALLAFAAAAFDAVLAASAAGSPGAWRVWDAPLREAARLLVRQRRNTLAADRLLRRTGIAVLPVAAVLAAAVLPLGGADAASDSSIGIVWFNAAEVAVWAGVWLAGWSVNSAYSLVGGYRIIAQGLAYELPHMFALITVGVGAESLRFADAVSAQHGLWFAVQMPVAFAVYLLSALAMAFWGPLASPVGRDLAGGAMAELSGADRLVFLAGRYAMLAVAAAATVPLFLGGGAGPLLPAWLWTLVKTLAVLAALVWAGHRVPVLRMDRFMGFAWTVLIPPTLLQLLVTSLIAL